MQSHCPIHAIDKRYKKNPLMQINGFFYILVHFLHFDKVLSNKNTFLLFFYGK